MKHRGFTLVETLTVFGIVGVLISLLVPALKGARREVKRVVCLWHLRSIGTALAMYEYDSGGYAPFIGKGPDVGVDTLKETPEEMLAEDLGNAWGVWQCPSDQDVSNRYWHFDLSEDVVANHREGSFTWPEALLRGFHSGHPDAAGRPWRAEKYDRFNGIILADGFRMLNVWDWRNALNPEYDLNSLDQDHGHVGEDPRVNVLFRDTRAKTITCDQETLELLRPW